MEIHTLESKWGMFSPPKYLLEYRGMEIEFKYAEVYVDSLPNNGNLSRRAKLKEVRGHGPVELVEITEYELVNKIEKLLPDEAVKKGPNMEKIE